MEWNDSRLKWDSSLYGGIQYTQFYADSIWIPDILI